MPRQGFVAAMGLGRSGVVTAGIACLAMAVVAVPAVPDANAAPAADRDATRVVVCDQFGASLSIRPTSFSLSCEDRDGLLTRLSWESWRKGRANGRGTFNYNTCQPSCASGQRRATHASVSLTRPTEQQGSRVFTRVTVRFTDAVGNRITKRYRAIAWNGQD